MRTLPLPLFFEYLYLYLAYTLTPVGTVELPCHAEFRSFFYIQPSVPSHASSSYLISYFACFGTHFLSAPTGESS